MPSSLFANTPMGNNPMFDMIKQFEEFKKQFGNSDPQAIVQNLLKTGKMSQEQYQQLSEMATQFQSLLR